MDKVDVREVINKCGWSNSDYFKFTDTPDIAEVAEVLGADEPPTSHFLDSFFELYSDNKALKEDETEFFDFFKKTYSVLNEKNLKWRLQGANRLHQRYIEYYLSKYDVDIEELANILSGLKYDEDFSEFKLSGKVLSLEQPDGLFVSGKNGILLIKKSDYPEDMKTGDILRVVGTNEEQNDYLVISTTVFSAVFYGILSRMWEELDPNKIKMDLMNIWKDIIDFMKKENISIVNDFEYKKVVLYRC